MGKLRKYAAAIAWVMALWVFNFSVDPPDTLLTEYTFHSSKHKKAHHNEMESIYEVVVEKVLGFSHAVPEANEHDHPLHHFKVVKSFCQPAPMVIEPALITESIQPIKCIKRYWLFANLYLGFTPDILSPPPRF